MTALIRDAFLFLRNNVHPGYFFGIALLAWLALGLYIRHVSRK